MTGFDNTAVAMQCVLDVVYGDAREGALWRLESAYMMLLNGGRLDVVAADLRWALGQITTVVDRRIATAERVLTAPAGRREAA